MAMIYRVSAGSVPADSWIQDTEMGGGRILGEVCHFIDYLTFLNGSLPMSIYATAMTEPNNLHDTLSVSIRYQNGSIGNIHYFANGSKLVPKEYVEIYQTGVTVLLNDFREISVFGNREPSKKRLLSQDKGQKNEVLQFIEAVQYGKDQLIPFEEIYSTSLVSFRILESIQLGETVAL